MDRNTRNLPEGSRPLVALRKESVDRNVLRPATRLYITVALRKESVDRNTFNIVTPHHPQLVALRKESVDRNKMAKGGALL